MAILRLNQSTIGPGKFRVEGVFEADGVPRQTAAAEFAFPVTPQNREDLRWYLEDFLQHPADPAPLIAARIEAQITAVGSSLFESLFQANDGFRELWSDLDGQLSESRIEIAAPVHEVSALPWELLRDPNTGRRLSLDAKTYVRAADRPMRQTAVPRSMSERTRILLVTCRPNGTDDVPFRSVASRLIKGLGASTLQPFELDVLRPATFGRLSDVLRKAKTEGEPYHVVHFDGHGEYEDLNAMYSGQPPTNPRGYLAFENPALGGNKEAIHGEMLGSLLAENDVPVLVLNACRSAYVEAQEKPVTANADDVGGGTDTLAQAYGSLAQEVVNAGVPGVVAMRYRAYVTTAAQFVANLYESLAGGRTLGEAVTASRRQLAAQPLREIGYSPRPLQDWMVPIVYEAAPVALFPQARHSEPTFTIRSDSSSPASDELAAPLQDEPAAGFFGRDETLFVVDRAFDTHRVVLLYGFAGSGKSSTAAEFARWYRATGGVEGPVLFTSFAQRKTLASVLDESIEPVFGKVLEERGRPWFALSEPERAKETLQILKQSSVLWIWDNVELVAGFPAGAPSAWSAAEQQSLADFVRSVHDASSRFLLISRRDEQRWLGDAVQVRCKMPSMPLTERVQLARALAKKHGQQLSDVTRWIPLLRFTDGNPLTITLLVGQVLRDALKTDAQFEAFIARLRAGEAAFADEESEGRSKSLSASLNYGFEHSFKEVERRQLALLHLFHQYLNADILFFMCQQGNPYSLPNMDDTEGASGKALLDRAAEIGLLTRAAGTAYYSLHPALPWFLKKHFDRYYRDSESAAAEVVGQHSAEHAFADAVGQLGEMGLQEFQKGNRWFLAILAREEENLLYARGLALANEWWSPLIETMQGLRVLYDNSGQQARWSGLVREIVPVLEDPESGGPVPGRESSWALLLSYRVDIDRSERQWNEAARLQTVLFKWRSRTSANRRDAAALLSRARDLEHLGDTQRWRHDPTCVKTYEQALQTFAAVDHSAGVSCAFNLGHAFMDIAVIHSLDQAEYWYSKAQELVPAGDLFGRSLCFAALAHVAFMRGTKCSSPQESFSLFTRAIELATRGLSGLPPN